MKPSPHRLLNITQQTQAEWTFKIETKNKPNIGQFYQVSLPRVGEMPISISGIGDGWIEMTIRSIGKVSSAVHALNVGENIFLRGPYGNGFPMEEFKDKHIVIAAGGSGVAPVRPIVEHYFNNPSEAKKVDLLFGFKEPSQILFQDDLARWKEKFDSIVTVDQACGIWDGECVGLITKYVQDIKLTEFKNLEVIIVGPPIMVKFTAEEFMKHGVAKEKIIVSLERNMSCGIGKCGHCKIDDSYVCLDGPVFRYPKAEKLID